VTTVAQSSRPAAEWDKVSPDQFERDIAARHEPAVLRGAVAHWPAVSAGRASLEAVRSYLSRFDRGAKVRAFVGPPEMAGRFFYRPGMDGFNFGIAETSFAQLLLVLTEQAAGRHIYMGSTATNEILPGFAGENSFDLIASKPTEPRIWIGNDSRIAPHFDETDNIACVVSGARRFTLFPPEQVANLYVGPIDVTVAGQPTSMVDLADPDLECFPRFAEAMKHAIVAELQPGDAIYIPAVWWHGVQSTGPLNVLVNYWWKDTPDDAGSPLNALGHALLSVSLLPEHKRLAWRHLFDHFVFKLNGEPAEHIPEDARGVLGRSTPELRRFMREFLISELRGKTGSRG
jgi:hypothetical protein